jgi:ABC-2 type transport system ATP-binding protein
MGRRAARAGPQVPAGSICGVLWENGAGGTTTSVLLGMARPSAGQASVLGLAADRQDTRVENRRRAAFVSDEKDLYGYMTVEEMIRFTAAFFPRWRPYLEQRYLRTFELPLNRKVKALSRGMRTKLALLLALCRGVELLILDGDVRGSTCDQEVLQALGAWPVKGVCSFFVASIAELGKIAAAIVIIVGKSIAAGSMSWLPPRSNGVRRRRRSQHSGAGRRR